MPRRVPSGHTLSCQLGSLTLALHHASGEWQLSSQHIDEADAPEVPELVLRAGALEDEGLERFLYAGSSDGLRFTPLLADRSVVIRPRQLVYLPPGEETTMYLSTPVTLRIELDDPSVTLKELPMLRLSDTWFGPSTREGELCYSGKTHARHELAEVPRRVHRAITPLTIRNAAPTVLPLEKVNLPVPLLSVYGAADGSLWTQGVSLQRGSDSDMAALKIDDAPPANAGEVSLLSGPRQAQSRAGLVRAFSLLFGD
ncbi:MAG: hypothetical protein JJU27_16405 [Gammaproteobacteria bacterium]|nr:hypothetical protein [Gammaproteobacteria bacterium]